MKRNNLVLTLKTAITALLLMSVLCIFSYAADTKAVFTKRCLNAWNNKAPSVDISDLDITATGLRQLFSAVLIEHCDYFYVEPTYSYSVSGGCVLEIDFEYADYTLKQIKSFNSTLQTITKKADICKTNLDKALFLHEYLIKNTNFNQNDTGRTAYDCLVKKDCVCEGYAKAYKLLMNNIGIKCFYVSSNENIHAWNIVELDGKRYYADLAWDDSAMTNENFLTSLDKCVKNGHTKAGNDWLMDYTTACSDKYNNKKYDNAFWTDAVTGLSYSDGLWYYSDGLSIYSYSTATGTKQKLATVDDSWYVWDKDGYYYPNGFSHVAVCNGRIYYNTSTTIRSMKKNGTNNIQEWKIPDSNKSLGYIYNIEADGSCVKYQLSKGPLENGFEYTKTGSFLPDTHTHKYTVTVTKATQSADGKTVKVCTLCNKKAAAVIPKISKVNISASTYTYNGKVRRPTVTVTDTKGGFLKNGTDYTVKYSDKSSKSVGVYTVAIIFKGDYKGAKSLTYKISPKKVTNLTASSEKKKTAKLAYDKVTGADSYQIYRADKIDGTYKKVKSATSLSVTISSLESGKTYYFKVRAYAKSGDSVLYGAFSDVKAVKIK